MEKIRTGRKNLGQDGKFKNMLVKFMTGHCGKNKDTAVRKLRRGQKNNDGMEISMITMFFLNYYKFIN